MREKLKTIAKKTLWRVGLDIKKFHPVNSSDCQRKILLQRLSIHNVIDIGANEGQYAKLLRSIGYTRKIISFEPVTAAHAALARAASSDRNWVVAPALAIGDVSGSVEIHVSGNSVSSSILDMNEGHIAAAPNSLTARTELVRVERLDNLSDELFDLTVPTLLKIDTQGYEAKVLAGSQKTLEKISALEIELSNAMLYEGQPNMFELVKAIQQLGFSLWGLWPEFAHPQSGQSLQFNGIFVRPIT